MHGQLDIITLIALIVAVVAIVKLKSVLGQRSDEDDARLERLRAREREAAKAAGGAMAGDVINLPRRETAEKPPVGPERQEEDSETRVRAFAAANPAVTNGLLAIARLDSKFDPEAFLSGAGRAYELIVSAFAEGNRKALRDLLSKEVYDGFALAIGEREGRGEKVDQQFVGIKKAEIVGAEEQNGIASITVRFVSELISAVLSNDGTLISGDPQRVSDVTDIWTFSRDISSRKALGDPNWKLVETQPPN